MAKKSADTTEIKLVNIKDWDSRHIACIPAATVSKVILNDQAHYEDHQESGKSKIRIPVMHEPLEVKDATGSVRVYLHAGYRLIPQDY